MNKHVQVDAPKLDVEAISAMIEASRIDPDPNNPRKFFDQGELQDLADSINRVGGLLQPILIRPTQNDRFMIVFGERRWRAHRIAKGEDTKLAVRICELTDEQVLYAQIDENDVRIATSPTEDAGSAARALEDCGGNRMEAIARLGWPASKFDRRMALNKLLPAARTALNERRILLGHAELLAAIHPENQEKALSTILSTNIDVATTRDLLAKLAHQLACAKFDRAECATCEFNSTLQRTLFETTVDDGACTNPTCYQEKTRQAETAEKAAAAAKAGWSASNGEGAKPAPAPKSTKPAPVAAATSLAATSPAATATDPTEANVAIPANSADVKSDAESEASADLAKTATSANPVKPETAAPPEPEPDLSAFATSRSSCIRKARPLREGLWRRALAQHLAENAIDAARVLLYAGYTGTLREVSRGTLPARADLLIAPGFEEKEANVQFEIICGLDMEAIERARCAIAAAYALDVPLFDHVHALATACKVDIRHLWNVDKAFLDLHTKDELKLLAIESGFTDEIGAKPFSRLAAGKREDMITGMLNQTSFDWTGRLPSSMTLTGRYSAPLS